MQSTKTTASKLAAPQQPPVPSRDRRLDAVRALAIIMVLLIHAASTELQQVPGSPDWWGALVWGAAARPAVPLFFMCSGALLLCRDITPKRILTHNLPRILCAMFAWAFFYQLSHLPDAGGFTPANLLAAVKSTLLLRHEFHFYYLHILLLVYAFLPILRVFVRNASRRELEYALAVWAVTGILFPLIQSFWPFSRVSPISSWWTMPMAYSAVGYALLGHYLRQYGNRLPRRWCAVALAAGLAITFGGTAVLSLESGKLSESFLSGMSPGPMLMAAGLFGGILTGTKERPLATKLTGLLARASFCVYLVHIVFLRLFLRLGFSGGNSPCLLFVPLVAALLLLCGFLVWAVLSRIPVVKSYLI